MFSGMSVTHQTFYNHIVKNIAVRILLGTNRNLRKFDCLRHDNENSVCQDMGTTGAWLHAPNPKRLAFFQSMSSWCPVSQLQGTLTFCFHFEPRQIDYMFNFQFPCCLQPTPETSGYPP